MQPETLLQEAEAFKAQIVEDRRYLHAHAETAFDLKETKAYVKARLMQMGYEPEECGRAGIVAYVGKKGKTFLLRSDMDGLPIQEESGESFACPSGNMHACGHDMHTAMLLGAARLLKQHESELQGMVKLDFQPAEEIFRGARDMIEDGLVKDVDGAMMMHVMTNTPLSEGCAVVCNSGVSAPACDFFTITVQGKGCHGSMPHMGVDPIVVMAHIVLALQEIQTRELAIQEQAVLTIGTFRAGQVPNVIPDEAVCQGSIRCFDEETRRYIKKRVEEVACQAAKMFRAAAQVSFGSACPTLVNDEALSVNTARYAKELLGENKAFTAGELAGGAAKSTGSEDFAYVSQQVPSIMVALAAGTPQKGHSYPLHHPRVTFDESVLPTGSALYAYVAARQLEEAIKIQVE